MTTENMTMRTGYLSYLRLKLWSARLIAALVVVAGAVSAYPAHRSFLTLLGGIGLGWVIVWMGAEIERAKRQIKEAEQPQKVSP